jgi:hypothetical protein
MGAALSLATTLVKVDRLHRHHAGDQSDKRLLLKKKKTAQGKLVSLLFFCMALFTSVAKTPQRKRQYITCSRPTEGSRFLRVSVQRSLE